MNPDSIERDILIEAPVDTVWRVVTEPGQIAKWFSDEASIDLQPGGEGALGFDGYGSVPIVVEAVEPPHRFAYRWTGPNGSGPRPDNATLVELTLAAEGEHTRLRLVESGLANATPDEAARQRFYDDHSAGWDKHLGELVEYAAGRGTRPPRAVAPR